MGMCVEIGNVRINFISEIKRDLQRQLTQFHLESLMNRLKQLLLLITIVAKQKNVLSA